MCRVDPCGDIVHAGAFFGDFIPALSSSRRSGAIVWAFEPSEASHRCAVETVRRNRLADVRLHRAGLGPTAGVATLATTDADGRALGGASHLAADPRDVSGCAHEDVPIVSIDEIIGEDRSVVAIHLDVEGQESCARGCHADT